MKRPARPRVALAPMWPVDTAVDELARVGDDHLLSALPDGWRCLVVLDDRVRIRSRAGRDLTAALPQLCPAWPALHRQAKSAAATVLDAVLVLPTDPARASEPTLESIQAFSVLDVLCWEGRVLTALPLVERRRFLQRLRDDEHGLVRVADLWQGSARDALEQVATSGQGAGAALLMRLASSPYRPGIRSPEWRCCAPQPLFEFVLCGIADSGALILGAPAPDGLIYAGSCWPTRAWSRLAVRCTPGAAPFAAPPIWPSLGKIAWAEPTLWVAVRRDVRSASGRGGPRWRFERVQEDLSLHPGPRRDPASASAGRHDVGGTTR